MTDRCIETCRFPAIRIVRGILVVVGVGPLVIVELERRWTATSRHRFGDVIVHFNITRRTSHCTTE